MRRYGRRPIEELYDLNVLGSRSVVAHAVWLDDAEIAILAATASSVVHCPCSLVCACGESTIGNPAKSDGSRRLAIIGCGRGDYAAASKT